MLEKKTIKLKIIVNTISYLKRNKQKPLKNNILKLNLLGGFFIEAGANNFESSSDSLHFELTHGWTVGWLSLIIKGSIY